MPFLISIDDNFSYNTITLDQEKKIESNQEMRVYQTLDVTQGSLQIDGILIIMDV